MVVSMLSLIVGSFLMAVKSAGSASGRSFLCGLWCCVSWAWPVWGLLLWPAAGDACISTSSIRSSIGMPLLISSLLILSTQLPRPLLRRRTVAAAPARGSRLLWTALRPKWNFLFSCWSFVSRWSQVVPPAHVNVSKVPVYNGVF